MYNLLIVDDDETSVEVLTTVIDWGKLGFDAVFKGYSAHEAKEILLKYDVSILVCDIEMLGGDGFKVIEYINENKLDCKTIFLTNYRYFTYAQKAVQLGSFDYLLKPVDFEQLKTSIARALEAFKEQTGNIEPTGCEEFLNEIDSKNKAVVSAIKYIKQNVSNNITREDVARFLFLNEIYLSKLFKSEVGITLSKYILKTKMEMACGLLQNGVKTVGEISEFLGYTQISHFSKLFSSFFNMTPSEYKKQMCK